MMRCRISGVTTRLRPLRGRRSRSRSAAPWETDFSFVSLVADGVTVSCWTGSTAPAAVGSAACSWVSGSAMRCRHRAAVLRLMSSSRLISLSLCPWLANKTMRARRANFWAVLPARVSASNPPRIASLMTTANPAMAYQNIKREKCPAPNVAVH